MLSPPPLLVGRLFSVPHSVCYASPTRPPSMFALSGMALWTASIPCGKMRSSLCACTEEQVQLGHVPLLEPALLPIVILDLLRVHTTGGSSAHTFVCW